jgi:hypothetical protein
MFAGFVVFGACFFFSVGPNDAFKQAKILCALFSIFKERSLLKKPTYSHER